MLALLGLVTIVTLLAAIMMKWMSPLVALILIPVAAALIGGFGWDTGKFIVSGLQSLAPVVGMFVFAILFFGVVTDAGMLDPIIDRILRTVGTKMTTGFPVSPLTPATFLVVGLTGIDLADHQRFTIPFLFGASLVMTVACLVLGVFPL